MKRLLLGSLLGLFVLAGCVATEDGKDAGPGNDTSGGEVSLDGFQRDGGDTLPGLDALGDALPEGGAGDLGPLDDSADPDQGGGTMDLVEDIPTGFGDAFQQEVCPNYCLALSLCDLTDGLEACETDCAAKLGTDADFGVQVVCTVQKYYGEETDCGEVAACASAQVDTRCEAACLRVGQCGLYEPPLNDMWGNTYDECLLSCSAGVDSESFDTNLACLAGALETCSTLSVLECFEGGDLKNCEALCDLASASSASWGQFGALCEDNQDCDSGYCVDSAFGKVCSQTCSESCPQDWTCEFQADAQPDPLFWCVPSNLDGCNLIGQDRLFADAQACHSWCEAQGAGPVFAAHACVGTLTDKEYFGFERPDTCADMATESCFPADLSLPPGAVAFTETFEGLCEVEAGEIPLPEILAWHIVGILEAAKLLDSADFYAAQDCLQAYETCPGESAWLDCFVPDKWVHSQALCARAIECMLELNPENPPDMTVGDCLFVVNFHQTDRPEELAAMWTCVEAAPEDCQAVKVCVSGPDEESR